MFKRMVSVHLASALLLVVYLILPIATNAQDITDDGVARSASLFSAFISNCQKSYFINVEEAKKYQRVFVEVGTKTVGKEKFAKLLAKEMKRRSQEVAKTGASQWCAYQKSYIGQIDGKLLEKPAAKFGSTADEMATLVASLVVAQSACGLQTNDVPLNAVIAKRGFELKAFLPDGAHSSLVETKIRGAKEFIDKLGSQKGCEGITTTVRKYLPEVVLTEDK